MQTENGVKRRNK